MLDRRQLLRGTVSLAVVAVAAPLLQGCDGATTSCADPELLSTGEEHMRKTLEYVELASNPAEECSACEFFSGSGDCGHCELLDGAVSARGYCTSWVAS